MSIGQAALAFCLTAPAEQTQRAEAGGEEREGGRQGGRRSRRHVPMFAG